MSPSLRPPDWGGGFSRALLSPALLPQDAGPTHFAQGLSVRDRKPSLGTLGCCFLSRDWAMEVGQGQGVAVSLLVGLPGDLPACPVTVQPEQQTCRRCGLYCLVLLCQLLAPQDCLYPGASSLPCSHCHQLWETVGSHYPRASSWGPRRGRTGAISLEALHPLSNVTKTTANTLQCVCSAQGHWLGTAHVQAGTGWNSRAHSPGS